MLTIISPDQFKQIPWKNGKGTTTELAINDGGTLDDFEWRLSIASVVEDGAFSDFSGYWRNLVLISGSGISLQHTLNGETKTDQLTRLLHVSSFDGGRKTYGKLLGKSSKVGISDFNIMTKKEQFNAEVNTYTNEETVKIKPCDICFVYSLNSPSTIKTTPEEQELPSEHLLRINSPKANTTTLNGKMMIVIYLFKLKTLTH